MLGSSGLLASTQSGGASYSTPTPPPSPEPSGTETAALATTEAAQFSDQQVQMGNGGETHQTAGADNSVLATQQGVPVADDQNSLRVGDRGPSLLEDSHFREKIFHFDHERIPERVVHARGYGAHGYFELYQPLTDITSADHQQHTEWLQQDIDLGFERIFIHNVNRALEHFIETFGEKVLPNLKPEETGLMLIVIAVLLVVFLTVATAQHQTSVNNDMTQTSDASSGSAFETVQVQGSQTLTAQLTITHQP